MKSEVKLLDLNSELTTRARVRGAFERFVSEISAEALIGKTSESDLAALAGLLFEVRESLRKLTKEEGALKIAIQALLPLREVAGGAQIAGDYIIIRDTRERKDLDKEAIARDFGPSVLERYLTKNIYEVMSVKRIGGE